MLLGFQWKLLNRLKNNIDNYYQTYFSSETNMGRDRILCEYINNLPSEYTIYYMINDNQEVVNDVVKIYSKYITNFTISTTLGVSAPNTIYIFSANESNIKNKIKKLKNTSFSILINDCTCANKIVPLSPFINKINPTKIITLTYPEKLTPVEKSNILMNKVGNVYANVDDAIQDGLLIKGFLSPTKNELQIFDNYRLELNLLLLGQYKRDELARLSGKNVINIICVENKDKINKYKNELIIEGRVKSNDILTDNTKKRIDENTSCKYIITTDMSKYYICSKYAMVFTMLKNTCKNGVLFNLIKSYSYNIHSADEEFYDKLQYKYLIAYDDVKMIKSSLKPYFVSENVKEVVINKCRNDINPISFLNANLKFAKFNNIEESDVAIKHLDNTLHYVFNGNLSKFRKFNFNFKKEPKTFMVDSFIKTYNDYIINSINVVDNILIENKKLCQKAIASALTSQDILNNKINGTKSAGWIMNYLQHYFLPFQVEENAFYNMMINDLNNQSYSVFRYIFDIFCSNYEKEQNIKATGNYKRKEETYMINIPFNSEEIKPSDIIKAKKCGMVYATNPKQENEKLFLQYLENNVNVDWWVKNGDNGKNYFSLTYYVENEPFSFYPDWIIMLKNGKVLITDTKDGRTVNDNGLTGIKLESLKKYCKEKGFYYGITTQLSGVWRISNPDNVYYIDKNFSNFIYLDDYLNEINKK